MRAAGLLGLLMLSAACSSWRWGSRPAEGGAAGRVLRDEAASNGLHPHPPLSPAERPARSEPRPRRPSATEGLAPPSSPEQLRSALFYSDLGPESLDVSSYPAQQRHNYEAYARACSRCHTLARSLNAPPVSRAWWEFYVLSMRVRGRLSGRPLAREEVQAALDFLEYDGRERKEGRLTEFEARSAELRRRFDSLMEERMEELQRQPRPPGD